MLKKHINHIQCHCNGMDVIIISLASDYEIDFWKERLDQMRGQIIKHQALIIPVVEDWERGAGNALGTLYAFNQANEKAQKVYGVDLFDRLENDDSIAIYHTAGKGTRLSPLSSCEYNSKSRIQLAGSLRSIKGDTPITLLEAVIKQTSLLAPHRKGRLSIFWGDQIFIPSQDIPKAECEIDLLIKPLKQTPSQQEWEQKKYDQYGFVIFDETGKMKQLEKLSYSEFANLELKSNESLGFSLGSFSFSHKILKAFLEEFRQELTEKKIALDSDPHFWMPITLEKALYLKIMGQKKLDLNFYSQHYDRMQTFKNKYLPISHSFLMGASSMGSQTLWWDFGNRVAYYKNHLKILDNDHEAELLRRFFKLNRPQTSSSSELKVKNSFLINCCIESGEIENSVLINVHSSKVICSNTILIDCFAQNIEAKESIGYNCLENKSLILIENQIRSDNISDEHGHLKLLNQIDSNLNWDKPVEGNSHSFREVYQMNQLINPDKSKKLTELLAKKIKQTSLFNNQ